MTANRAEMRWRICIDKTLRGVALLALCTLASCQQAMDQTAAPVTRIVYQTEIIPNPVHEGEGAYEFSKKLLYRIYQDNVPQTKTIWVDGEHSRTEYIDNDYGLIGPVTLIRVSEGEAMQETYARAFPFVKWYLTYPALEEDTSLPPHFEPLEGQKEIAGYACKQGRVIDANGAYEIYYCPDLMITDKTEAIPQFEGVPGLIMEKQPVPTKFMSLFLQKERVVEIESVVSAEDRFDVPEGYEHYADANAARIENRRQLEIQGREEQRQSPLTKEEREKIFGPWLLNTGLDQILMEIVPTSYSDPLTVLTHNFTSRHPTLPRRQERPGLFIGTKVLAEDPPNFRLYALNAGGDTLVWQDHPAFTYRRISTEEAEALKSHYQDQ